MNPLHPDYVPSSFQLLSSLTYLLLCPILIHIQQPNHLIIFTLETYLGQPIHYFRCPSIFLQKQVPYASRPYSTHEVTNTFTQANQLMSLSNVHQYTSH